MSPEKLFDYLDDELPEHERAELEQRLASDAHLRQQLATARKIHKSMTGSREVIGARQSRSEQERGAVLGRRVAVAFIVLVALNVVLGITYIYFSGGAKKPGFGPDEAKVRQQLAASIANTQAASPLNEPTLGIDEITIVAPLEQRDFAVQQVIAAAEKAGGSGTKTLPNETGVSVLVDLPSEREGEFRAAIAPLAPIGYEPTTSNEPRKMFQIRIANAAAR